MPYMLWRFGSPHSLHGGREDAYARVFRGGIFSTIIGAKDLVNQCFLNKSWSALMGVWGAVCCPEGAEEGADPEAVEGAVKLGRRLPGVTFGLSIVPPNAIG